MKAEQELLATYRDWHRIARAEAKAIRTRNWDLLADCQIAIKDFQTLAARLTSEARQEWERAGADCAEKTRHVQVFINDLIEITRQNQAMLRQAKEAAHLQLEQISEAGRNLKLLHRSYGNMAVTA